MVKGDDDFALSVGFVRRDDDPRAISEIPEDKLRTIEGGAFTLLPADRTSHIRHG
jgi:hypothetical protein